MMQIWGGQFISTPALSDIPAMPPLVCGKSIGFTLIALHCKMFFLFVSVNQSCKLTISQNRFTHSSLLCDWLIIMLLVEANPERATLQRERLLGWETSTGGPFKCESFQTC
jgi:hypothetical protein